MGGNDLFKGITSNKFENWDEIIYYSLFREKKYIDSHKFTNGGNIHIYTLMLWKKEKELESN